MAEKTFGKKGFIFSVVLIIVLVLVLGFNVMRASRKGVEKQIQEEAIPVTVLPSESREIDEILALTGNIRAQLEVDVSFKIPGKIITDIFVDTGDRIDAGDKIAVLEKASILAKLDQANAALDLAMANFSQAETNLEVLVKDKKRLENLYKEKAVSRQKLDHMEAQVKTAIETKKLAGAQIKQAQATLKELDIALADHTLEAPISGYISKRYLDKGAMSSPAAPVVKISKEDELKIEAAVTEKNFVHIQKGMPVDIGVDAQPGKIIKGSITIVSPTINPETRTGEVEIHIKNDEKMLRAGMFARVNIHLGKKKATVVSRDAIMRIPGTGGKFVYVVEDGKAVQKNVKTGIEQEKIIEIASGLKPGEKVIVTGQNQIREGLPVIIE